MTRRRPAGARGRAARPADAAGLIVLGLVPGERVRFRPRAVGRWQEGSVTRRERDGSIGITDGKGAARAIPVERIEVGCTGPRGGSGWEPLTARASRSEQLRLL